MTAKVLQTVQILETEPAIATAASQQRWSFAGGARTIADPVRRISASDAVHPLTQIIMALAASIIKRSAVSATIRSRAARARTVAVLLLLMWGAGVVTQREHAAVTSLL